MNSFILEEQDLEKELSDEELKYYYDLFKMGDIKSRNKIIECNLRLVPLIVKKYFNQYNILDDDLIQIGYLGLIKAVDHYDISKNYKFSSYASACIINEINSYYVRSKSIKDTISLDAEIIIGNDEEKTNLYELVPADKEEFTVTFERNDYLYYLLDTLSYVDRDIIEMYYGIGEYKRRYNQKEIAEKYCVSHQCISDRVIKSLNELKHAAESPKFRKFKILRRENS